MKTFVKIILLALLGVAGLHGQGPPPISAINAGTNITVTRSGPAVTISSTGGGGSNAINLSTSTGLANTASLVMPLGMVLTLSGSTPVTLSMGTGLNTFAGGLSSSGVLRVTNATASTGTTSGAAIITGGLGVQGALYGTSASFSGTVAIGTTGLLTYIGGNGQIQFSSFGGHALLTDFGGNNGLGIAAPQLLVSSNGSYPTATYGSTSYGGGIWFQTNSFTAVIFAGGPTQVAGGDGVTVANRFVIAASSNTVSATIESVSGAINTYHGLAISNTAASGSTVSYSKYGIVTLSSGVATITNSVITSNSTTIRVWGPVSFNGVSSASGTIGVPAAYASVIRTGSASFTAAATDNSVYHYQIIISPDTP
jgi:hypothetical protein